MGDNNIWVGLAQFKIDKVVLTLLAGFLLVVCETPALLWYKFFSINPVESAHLVPQSICVRPMMLVLTFSLSIVLGQ